MANLQEQLRTNSLEHTQLTDSSVRSAEQGFNAAVDALKRGDRCCNEMRFFGPINVREVIRVYFVSLRSGNMKKSNKLKGLNHFLFFIALF